jgi:DNA repair exonuclease SbcCD ATPase subunit
MQNDAVVHVFLYILTIVQALMGVIFGILVWMIRANKSEVDKRLEHKQDTALCDEIRRGFLADLDRGDKKFAEVIKEMREQTKAFSELSAYLSKIATRLDYLERRRSGEGVHHPYRRDEDNAVFEELQTLREAQ